MNNAVISSFSEDWNNKCPWWLNLDRFLDHMKLVDEARDYWYPLTVRCNTDEIIQCWNDSISHKNNKKLQQESNKERKRRLKQEKQDANTKARQERNNNS